MEFLEYMQRGKSFIGAIEIRILPRGPWIDILTQPDTAVLLPDGQK